MDIVALLCSHRRFGDFWQVLSCVTGIPHTNDHQDDATERGGCEMVVWIAKDLIAKLALLYKVLELLHEMASL